jgi:predicted O-methyltransferase YrrM
MWLANRLFPSVRRLQARVSQAETAAQSGAKSLSHEQIAKEFERRGPWISQFRFNGRIYGGDRIDSNLEVGALFRQVPNHGRILELGPLDGGHTLALAQAAGVGEIVAIDGREQNVRRASFIVDLYGLKNASVLLHDLRTFDIATLGHFDLVFCSGVLYHLPEPWKLIEQCAKVAPALHLGTHYAPETKPTHIANGYHVYTYYEGELSHPFSGLQAEALWFTLPSLFRVLNDAGYGTIIATGHTLTMPQGPAISLMALR